MGELQIYFTQWEKPDIKEHILYDSIYMKRSEKANLQGQEVY